VIPLSYTSLSDTSFYISVYEDLDNLLSSSTNPLSLIPSTLLVSSIMRGIRLGLEIGAW